MSPTRQFLIRRAQLEPQSVAKHSSALPKARVGPAFGNQTMQRLLEQRVIQAKLKVSEPDDEYEREADRVADAVMRMPEPRIQRACPGCDEEEKVQTKPLADQITPLVQRQVEPEEEEEKEEPVQTKLTSDMRVQRRAAEPEEEEEEPIQTKAVSGRTPIITRSVQAQINSLRDGGQPLPAGVRKFFEPRFGHDFSQVRLHSDGRAAEMARAFNAKAFTVGHDIVFGRRRYAPGTRTGKELLGHELTHVIQQQRALPFHGTKPDINMPGRYSSIDRLAWIGGISVAQQIQRAECETQPLGRCAGKQHKTVLTAFKLAANWLGEAKPKVEEYIKNPTQRSNLKVAQAFKNHFRWTEAARKELTYADVPREAEKIINLIYKKISVPFHPFCRTVPSGQKEDAEKLSAASPAPWAKTNCYEFYPPFFEGRLSNERFQARAILHEMMHSWVDLGDVAYEWQRNKYPLRSGAAIHNANSYAALIRDIGSKVR